MCVCDYREPHLLELVERLPEVQLGGTVRPARAVDGPLENGSGSDGSTYGYSRALLQSPKALEVI
jgi:hypothetical protein